MNDKYIDVYEKRWKFSKGTRDEDILALEKPKRQVEFFYNRYNNFISDEIRKIIGNCENKKLLEIGCGRATSSISQALRLGINVVPTDYSEGALKIARKNLDKYGVNAEARRENLYNLSFEDEFFDVVISLGVMEHIEQPERAYREMFRVLKSNGVMLSMNVPERPDNIQRIAAPINKVLAKIKEIFGKREARPWLDKETRSKTADVYRSELNGREFAKIVRGAGFKNVEAVEVNPFPTFDPLPEWMDYLAVKIYELIMVLRKIMFIENNPFVCRQENSRAHFIVAQKN
jgi:ubiquinone/menaquinone biosynthesis C-methylase UbiE